MARIRTIKPEFWSTPNPPADPIARLLFIAMWNWADDNGIGTCVEKELLGFAFPYDDVTMGEFRRHLGAIHRHFGVVFYTVNGRPFYSIPSWKEHQKIDPRFKGRHPSPDEAETVLYQDLREDVGVSPPHVGGALETLPTGTGEQGNRGTGEQGNDSTVALVEGSGGTPTKAGARRRPRSYLPTDFAPDVDVITSMMNELSCDKSDLLAQHRKFCDYWTGEGKMKTDWTATWRNWMRTAHQRGEIGQASSSRPLSTVDAKAVDYQSMKDPDE